MIKAVDLWMKWGEDCGGCAREPMPEDISHIFVMMTLNEFEDDPRSRIPEEIETSMGYVILRQRGDRLGLAITPSARVFLSAICDSPGAAVVYVNFLRWAQLKRSLTSISMGELANIFPTGFFSKRGMDTAWEAQKGYTQDPQEKFDNLLDQVSAAELFP